MSTVPQELDRRLYGLRFVCWRRADESFHICHQLVTRAMAVTPLLVRSLRLVSAQDPALCLRMRIPHASLQHRRCRCKASAEMQRTGKGCAVHACRLQLAAPCADRGRGFDAAVESSGHCSSAAAASEDQSRSHAPPALLQQSYQIAAANLMVYTAISSRDSKK